MRALPTRRWDATRCGCSLGESAVCFEKCKGLRFFVSRRDNSALVSLIGCRRISSFVESPSTPDSSPASGRGGALASAAKGLWGKLRSLYFEMQVLLNRQMNAVRAEEAPGGMAGIHEGNDRVFTNTTTGLVECAKSSGGQFGAPGSPCCLPLISRNPMLCPRSALFVPCSKPRALAKVPTLLHADCFILDLEDSVGVRSKRQARENLRAFVEDVQRRYKIKRVAKVTGAGGGGAAAEWREHYPRLVVRINSPDYDYATAMLDLELVGQLGPAIEGVAVPKTTVNTYELIRDHLHPCHQLWAFFESPRSVIQAPLICQQKVYRYAVMGYNDLSAELQLPLGAPSLVPGSTCGNSMSETVKESLYVSTRLPLWHSAVQVLLAARAHDMFVLDGVFNDPTDKVGFCRSLQESRLLGLDGKTLIHPDQVALTNKMYTPKEAEVSWAQRVTEQVQRFEGDVSTVDGKMQEVCHQRQAGRVLALHRCAELEKQLRMTKTLQCTTETGASSHSVDFISETDVAGDTVNARGLQPRRTPSRHRSVV